jgi:hypothetical protein
MSKLDRATTEYDAEHERDLGDALIATIIKHSMVDGVMVIRTGEIAAALTSVLAMTLALSPSAVRSPAAIREISEKVRKKLLRQVHAAERDPTLHDLLSRTFNYSDRKRGGAA